MSRALRLCLIMVVGMAGIIGTVSSASAAGFAGAPYISSGTTPNNGFFTLSWAPASGTPPVNYFVNRYDPRLNQVNGLVAFVETDTTYTFAGAGEIEGVWQYYIGASDATSGTGGPLGVVVTIDKTGPTPPTATPDRAPDTANGWYKDTVTVTYAGSVDPNLATGEAGTGVAGYSAPQTFNTDGSQSYSGTATDNVGNVSAAATGSVNVDAAPPAVTCDPAPTAWQGSSVTLACTATDAGAG